MACGATRNEVNRVMRASFGLTNRGKLIFALPQLLCSQALRSGVIVPIASCKLMTLQVLGINPDEL
jgi:hypothetical protein